MKIKSLISLLVVTAIITPTHAGHHRISSRKRLRQTTDRQNLSHDNTSNVNSNSDKIGIEKYLESVNSYSRPENSASRLRGNDQLTLSNDNKKRKMSLSTTSLDERNLAKSAHVKLVNNCGFDASIGIIFYGGKSNKKTYIWKKIKNKSSYLLIHVNDPTIYLYGFDVKNEKELVWGNKKSKHCISAGKCLSPKKVGPFSKATIRYNLCPKAKASPTPSPIAKAPPTPALNDVDEDWLKGHNKRRTNFFSKNGLGPKNLKWAQSLKESAQAYADKLVELGGDTKCVIQHGYKGDEYGGENISSNWGVSVSTVSATPEEVLNGWYDEEINLPLGMNGHATQVVFRSTHYVGCGRAQKNLSNGGKCFINVCRYLSPGNCNMSQNGWKSRTLDEEVVCDPFCPKEGCF